MGPWFRRRETYPDVHISTTPLGGRYYVLEEKKWAFMDQVRRNRREERT